MRKVLIVAVREYLASVRTKAFIISLVIMPVLMLGSIAVQHLLQGFRDTKKETYAVIDRSGGGFYPLLKEDAERYNETQTKDQSGKPIKPQFDLEEADLGDGSEAHVNELREQLSERVKHGDLVGFLEIGPDVLKPPPAAEKPQALETEAEKKERERRGIRYQSNRPTHEEFARLAAQKITHVVQERRCAEEKLALNKVERLLRPVELHPKGLSQRNRKTDKVEDASDKDRFIPLVVPGALMMLMFMVMMMGATPLMQGVLEEKMQRIAEVLLGSVQPFALMLGKLLGMTAVSLTITAVYLGGGLWAAYEYDFTRYLGVGLLLWFFLFQALASLMYGSLFIAIGAACTDTKETQNLLWPVMLLACLPMFVLGNVLQEPNSAVCTGMSFFPFATPMLMTARLGVPPGVPWWQPVLGVAVVLATTLACVWAAGRIFRVGLLMQGKGASFREITRWVFRG
jgi:ABC-2 type transport system permease protein